jgi:hypothetical protein
MARPKAKAPARTYHMSGQSIVRIDGKDFYLGKHDSPESIARYAVLIGIYQKHGLSLPDDFCVDHLDEMAGLLLGMASPAATTQPTGPITVGHITAIYREHIKTKYPHSEQDRQRCERLCEILDERYASLPVEDFGPVRLNEIRNLLTEDGLQKATTKAANGKNKPRINKPSRSYVIGVELCWRATRRGIAESWREDSRGGSCGESMGPSCWADLSAVGWLNVSCSMAGAVDDKFSLAAVTAVCIGLVS